MKLKLPEGFPQPLGRSIFVLHHDSNIKTKGGIIIPEVAKSQSKRGLIAGVGPDCLFNVNDKGKVRKLQIGDEVVYNHFADRVITYDGQDYLHMSEIDIQAFFPEPEKTDVKSKGLKKPKRGFDGHKGESVRE